MELVGRRETRDLISATPEFSRYLTAESERRSPNMKTETAVRAGSSTSAILE